MLKAPKTQ